MQPVALQLSLGVISFSLRVYARIKEFPCPKIIMYYVIQVKTGKEQETINNIKKYKKSDVDFDVFSPYRKELRKYRGEFKEVVVRCFPGYIFVETDDIEQLFYDLYWVPGFQKILGREGLTHNFVPLTEDESRMIDILYSKNNNRITEISDIVVHEGDEIAIIDGPLMGIKTKIVKVFLHKRKVRVGITLCNNYIETDVGINIITRANS